MAIRNDVGARPLHSYRGATRGLNMRVNKHVVAAAMGTVMLAFSAASASAAYACNGNVCWVVKDRYEYPAESKVIIREEAWKPSAEIVVRDHGEGRGYWRDSAWTRW
jgi:hypothetical protein